MRPPARIEKRSRLLCLVTLYFYDYKSCFPGYFWVLAAYLALSLILITENSLDLVERKIRIALLLEVVPPLITGFFSNIVLLAEVETGSLVFTATRQGIVKLWARRLLLANGIYVMLMLVQYSIITSIYPGVIHFSSVFVSIPTCLFFSCLISGISFGFIDMNSGYLAGIFIWSINFLGARAILSVVGPRFYLFMWWASQKYPPPFEQLWVSKVIIMGFTILIFILCCLLVRIRSKTLMVSS